MRPWRKASVYIASRPCYRHINEINGAKGSLDLGRFKRTQKEMLPEKQIAINSHFLPKEGEWKWKDKPQICSVTPYLLNNMRCRRIQAGYG